MRKTRLLVAVAMACVAMGMHAQTATTWITEGESFTDGTLIYWIKNYPNGYTEPAGNVYHTTGTYTYESGKGLLADDEVAISLLKDEDLTVTDTIFISSKDAYTYYRNTLFNLTTWYDKEVRKRTEDTKLDSTYTLDGVKYTFLGCLGATCRDTEFTHYFHGGSTPTPSSSLASAKVQDQTASGYRLFFKREGYSVKGSTVKLVTIPTTISAPDGTAYKVGVVAFGAFDYDKRTHYWQSYCFNGYEWGGINQMFFGGNDYLESVTFAAGSNVHHILGYAFFGLTKLRSITIPRTVESLGNAAFEMCHMLSNVTFQTEVNSNASSLKYIGTYCFEGIPITTITIPEGVTEMGGSSIRYNLQLKQISLPNTLQKVGSHFLCCCKQLETITIPASLTDIDGALFHGCESLKEIYMLGYANNLKANAGNFTTFSANAQWCADAVDKDNVKLYVPVTYLGDYQSHPVWKELTNIEETPGAYRDFTGKKWATAIFPMGVKNYKSVFGEGSSYAIMASAKREAGWYPDPQTGKLMVMYTLSFEKQDGDDIPEDTPIMFYPENSVSHPMWYDSDMDEAFIADMTQSHAYGVDADNDDDADNSHLDAYITMNGYYVPTKMGVWDFYITTVDGKQQFRRVPSVDKAATAGATRCFWTVRVNGLPVESAGSSVKDRFFYDDTDAIARVVIDGEPDAYIYDMSGRRLDLSVSQLPSGLYVVKGKKVVIQ